MKEVDIDKMLSLDVILGSHEETIKEVCEWLKSNWMKYHWYDPYEDNEGYNGNGLIEDLKKHFNIE